MKALIGGGTGFIGQNLVRLLEKKGYEIIYISRRVDRKSITWADLHRSGLPEGITAVISLQGEPLLNPFKRWSETLAEEIYTSRINTTKALVDAIVAAKQKPKVFISTSGVGYYPPSTSAEYTEDSKIESFDYISRLATDWESAATLPEKIGVRQAVVRVGVALGREGGAIMNLYMPFFFGLGGRIGSGKQPFPWIHAEDIAGIYAHIVENDVSGVFNGVAPTSTSDTNSDFAKAFAKALRRPAIFPTPAFAINSVFGNERAKILLEGQRVIPKRALESGYKFKYPTLASACKECSRFFFRLNTNVS